MQEPDADPKKIGSRYPQRDMADMKPAGHSADEDGLLSIPD